VIVLDRNSQICFHRGMIADGFMKTKRASRHARAAA
jgi:hypothetical protein